MSAFKIEGDKEIEKRKTLIDQLLEYFIPLRRHSLSPMDKLMREEQGYDESFFVEREIENKIQVLIEKLEIPKENQEYYYGILGETNQENDTSIDGRF